MARLFARIRSKLSSTEGETLVETLVSTLIIAGVMLMLCTAIVAAARVNATIDTTETIFAKTDDSNLVTSTFSVTISHDNGGTSQTLSSSNYKAYKTDNGFYYYEPAAGSGASANATSLLTEGGDDLDD